jgi:hypothetical protein
MKQTSLQLSDELSVRLDVEKKLGYVETELQ